MSKNEIGQDSPIPKFIHLKIRCQDGVESLMILEEGEFKVPIDGCIRWSPWMNWVTIISATVSKSMKCICDMVKLIVKLYVHMEKWQSDVQQLLFHFQFQIKTKTESGLTS